MVRYLQAVALGLGGGLGVFCLSRIGKKSVPGRWIFLFRAFFPSWQFFDGLGDVPFLEYRWGQVGGRMGYWKQAHSPLSRRWFNVLVHSQGNLALAYESLLAQFLSDLSERDSWDESAFSELASYGVLQNWVRRQIQTDAGEGARETPMCYQFRLQTRSAQSGSFVSDGEEVWVSQVHRFSGPPPSHPDGGSVS